MSKLTDFFKPQRLGFHLILAAVITVIIILLADYILGRYTKNGQEVELPDYVGMSAEELMNNHDNFVFVVRNTVVDKKKKEGTVVGQDPLSGDKVKPGRKVFLTITTRTPKKVKMPQVAGDHGLRQATNLLESAGLILENVIYVESETPGQVVAQYYRNRPIKAGTMIDEGSKITLHVGAEPIAEPEEEPAPENTNFYELPDNIDF